MNISSFLLGYQAAKNAGGGGSSADVRYVTFMSYDGTEEHGRLPVATGYDCPNPKFTVTRESDAQYDYVLAGWATTPNGALDANALKAVEEDRTVYANFASVLRYYTVNYYDDDRVTLLNTKSVTYGSDASYKPQKEGYKFIGWSEDITNVTADIDVYAIWEIDDGYIHDSWETVVERAKNGTASNYYKAGNKIALPLTYADGTTESVDMYLISFNCGVDTDGNNANVAFFCANALQKLSPYFIESIRSNTVETKYPNATLVTHLENDVFPAMPTVLQNNILAREHLTQTYISGCKLWPAFDIDLNEPFMNARYCTKIYEVLPAGESRIMYQKGGDTPVEYWIADLKQSTYYYGKIIDTTGAGPTPVSENPSSKPRGVVFGFLL